MAIHVRLPGKHESLHNEAIDKAARVPQRPGSPSRSEPPKKTVSGPVEPASRCVNRQSSGDVGMEEEVADMICSGSLEAQQLARRALSAHLSYG